MISGDSGGEEPENSVALLQAALFCRQLHVELDRIDTALSALHATLARQLARADLRQHAAITERELTSITDERARIHKMLSALGHAYPCNRGGC